MLPDKGNLAKTGYMFTGWNTQANGAGSNYNAGSSYVVTGDITLYANWTFNPNAVSLNNVTADGSEIQTTSVLTLTFSKAIPGLSAEDITLNGINDVIKGTLNGAGPVYTLPISGFTESGTLSVEASKANYDITGIQNTAGIYYYPVNVMGSTLAAKLNWVRGQMLAGDQTNKYHTYLLEVTADDTITPQTLPYNKENITIILKGTGGEKKISLSTSGSSLFTVNSGAKLILDEAITLNGRTDNNIALSMVNGGTLVMKTGSKITGNTNYSYSGSTYTRCGGGVYLNGGNFVMYGGEISNNKAGAITTASGYGGGVYVNGGIFTMHGGKISGNTALGEATAMSSMYVNYRCGGGVYVNANGSFIMYGGEISGNTTEQGGNGNRGSGICSSGTVRIVTGTIMNNIPASDNSYFYSGTVAQYGMFDGSTWISRGNLPSGTTWGGSLPSSIRVVNGVLQ